jgi:hypothetical protein
VPQNGLAGRQAQRHLPFDPVGHGLRVGQPCGQHDHPRHGLQDLGFVLEVVIQRRCLHVELPGQPGQTERFQALRVDDSQGGLYYGVAHDEGLGGSRHTCIMRDLVTENLKPYRYA